MFSHHYLSRVFRLGTSLWFFFQAKLPSFFFILGSNCKLQNFVPFQHYVNGTHVSRTVWFVFIKTGMQRKPVQVQEEHAPFAKKGFREPCDSNVEPSNHWITKCFLLWLILVKRELAFAPKGHVICFTQVVRIKIYLFTFTSWTFCIN